MNSRRFWKDIERSQTFRAETLRYIRLCMGLSSEVFSEKSSPIIDRFKIIGNAIRDAYNIGKKTLLPLRASSTDTTCVG